VFPTALTTEAVVDLADDAEVREGTELYPGPFNIILTNSIDETEQTLLSEIFEFQTVDSYSCGLDNVSYHRQVLPY
jgi:hypothetical protein